MPNQPSASAINRVEPAVFNHVVALRLAGRANVDQLVGHGRSGPIRSAGIELPDLFTACCVDREQLLIVGGPDVQNSVPDSRRRLYKRSPVEKLPFNFAGEEVKREKV